MNSLFKSTADLAPRLLRAAAAVSFTLLLSSCVIPGPEDQWLTGLSPDLQGSFIEGRYYDPKGMFSIKMNQFEQAYILEDDNPSSRVSSVTFLSTSDEFRSVRVDDVTKQLSELPPGFCSYAGNLAQVFRGLFNDHVLPDIKRGIRGVTVEYEQLRQDGGPGFFAIIRSPEAHGASIGPTRRFLNRYYAYSFTLDHAQQILMVADRVADRPIDEVIEEMRNLIDEMRANYRNETI